MVVWAGRYQPLHLGHVRMLSRSLERFPEHHLIAVTTPLRGQRPAAHLRSDPKLDDCYNPLEPWEVWWAFRLVLEAEGWDRRVSVIHVPRHDSRSGGTDRFFPPGVIRCATNKDPDDQAKIDRWAARGYRTRLLDVSGLTLTSGTQIRESLRAGGSLNEWTHPSTWDFFEAIGARERILGSTLGAE